MVGTMVIGACLCSPILLSSPLTLTLTLTLTLILTLILSLTLTLNPNRHPGAEQLYVDLGSPFNQQPHKTVMVYMQ